MYFLQNSPHQQEKIPDISNIKVVSKREGSLINMLSTSKQIEEKLTNEG